MAAFSSTPSPRSSLRAALVAVALIAAACSNAAAPTATPERATPTPASTPATTAPPSPTAAPAFPVAVTDDEGTEVTITAEPQVIVSLTPATTETLFAIGAGDRVAGKSEDVANYPPEAADVPVVATFAGVDVERIVALEPDLVVSAGAGLTQGDAVEQLRRAGIPVIVSYPTTVDGGLASIRQIGQAVGKAAEAEALATSIERRLDALAALAATAPSKPRVFYEIDVTGGIFTPPSDSIYGDMLDRAGSTPIPGDASYSISLEELVAADPEVILLGDGAYGQSPDTVRAREGWGGMTAVKTGRIVAVDDIVVTRPGPRIADGLEALVRAIHPELADQIPAVSGGPSPATSLHWLPAAA